MKVRLEQIGKLTNCIQQKGISQMVHSHLRGLPYEWQCHFLRQMFCELTFEKDNFPALIPLNFWECVLPQYRCWCPQMGKRRQANSIMNISSKMLTLMCFYLQSLSNFGDAARYLGETPEAAVDGAAVADAALRAHLGGAARDTPPLGHPSQQHQHSHQNAQPTHSPHRGPTTFAHLFWINVRDFQSGS